MSRNLFLALALTLLCGFFLAPAGRATALAADIPAPGTVTLVDLGAKACVPCKMMAPILEELEKEYQGKAAVVFVDVWQNDGQAERFGVKAIPTQIFYGRDGKEAFRHTGFMDKQSIRDRLDKLIGG